MEPQEAKRYLRNNYDIIVNGIQHLPQEVSSLTIFSDEHLSGSGL
jgi:hypothetical protein